MNYLQSALSYIVGNQLIKNTELQKESFGQGGHNNQWHLYQGTKTDTKKAVCGFMHDKKHSKSQQVEFLKKEPTSLIKFKHPKILQIVEPLIEDKKYLGYATEQFDQTLQQKLQKNQEVCGSQIELKIQLQNIFQILNFLHYTVKSGHFNLSPSNIYILPDGTWKLGGFQFSAQILDNDTSVSNLDINNLQNPDFNYMAPEIQKNGKGQFTSDIFSLGLLIAQLFKNVHEKGKYNPIFDIQSQQSYVSEMQNVIGKIQKQAFYQAMDQDLQGLLARMLSDNPDQRPQISELIHCKWLNDPYVKAMKHLDTIHNIEQQQQTNFLKGLGQILFKYPETISKKKIIPQLLELFQYPHLILPVLQICIDSIEKLTKQEYSAIIWPKLQKLTVQKEMPAQALYILVENIEKLYQIAGQKQIEQSIILLLLKCYDCQVPKLQELGLSKSEFIIKNWDYGSFSKPKIIPRIMNILGNEKTAINIKKLCLSLIKNLLKVLDKQSKNDLLIPALEKLRKTKTDIEVRMSMLQIYQQISKDLDINTIGGKLVPSLLPFLIDPNLKRNEYMEYSKTIQQFLKKIDEERLKELPIESDQFDFDAIANKTNLDNVSQKKQQEDSSQPNQINDFDFLDSLASGMQQKNIQPQQTNSQNDLDLLNGSNNQQQNINSNVNQTQVGYQNQKSKVSDQFGQSQQQNTIQNNRVSNQQQQQKQQLHDPFFDQFNQNQSDFTSQNTQNKSSNIPQVAPPKKQTQPTQSNQNNNLNTKQQQQYSKPQPVSQDPFFDTLNKQQQKPLQQQSQMQQNQDPFFAEFNNQQQNQGQKQNYQQPNFSNQISSNDDPFADIPTSNTSNYSQPSNNFNNNQNQMNFTSNIVGNNNSNNQNYDNPFAEIENSNVQNQNQSSMTQNNTKNTNNQNKGQLFSKMQIKKPQQQQQQQNSNQNKNNNDFDLI